MSAEAAVLSPGPLGWVRRYRHRSDLSPEERQKLARVYRLTFGMTLSAGIAFLLAWPLSFIAPVLAAKLLSLPKVLPFKTGLALVVILGLAFLLSSLLLLPTMRYPSVHLLLVALILFRLFYAKAGGANPILVTFVAIGVVVIPLIGSTSLSLASGVAKGLTFAAFVAVAVVYTAAAVFPDPADLGPTVASRAAVAAAKPDPPEDRVRFALALRSLIVIFPLYFLFLSFSLADSAVVLIFALLLSLEPRFGTQWAAGKGLLLANLVGGLVAVMVYNLLVWVPAYAFFLLIITLAGLIVGRLIVSGSVLGQLLAGGITTVFIVMGPALTSDEDAGAKLMVRVGQIMLAVLFVVIAFAIMERLTRGRRVAE